MIYTKLSAVDDATKKAKNKKKLLNNIDGLIKAAQYNKNRYVVGRIIIHEYGHLPSINGLCFAR